MVRVRFAPSPTGYLHIGGARTVLFNWLAARKAGGAFLLRIEDTDQARNVADSVQKILSDLRWLGLTWDEGPEVGGEFGPYFQSQRLDLYSRYIQQLLEAGHAYYALETTQELESMRKAASASGGGFRYRRPDPIPTIEQGVAARSQGRQVVVRLKMPDADIVVHDDILGDVRMPADQLDDFVIQKGDGFPTYHFACAVDDELMKITHVLRGQEHLMNTPKHVALQRALGFSTPRYAHLPVIFNMDGSKMSKRDKDKALKAGLPPPEIDVHDFRTAGYLPEALLNFIALLGWNPGDEREFFTLDELVDVFDISRVGRTNARFDREKLLSFNTTWSARLPEPRLLEAFKDFLQANASARATSSSLVFQRSGLPPTDDELLAVLRACAGFRTFSDVMKKAGFLFTPDDAIEFDPQAVKKVLQKNDNAGLAMLTHLLPKFEVATDWTAESLESLIKQACEEKQVGMGAVAQPVRVAISGSTISPAIGLSLELLGKERTMSRVRRCLARLS
jgi:glutamyl-tRNA synthetase